MTFASWRGAATSIAAIGCALILQACGGGGGGGGNPAQPSGRTDPGAQTTTPGVPVAVSAAASAVVQVAGSTAQVSLPANAFVAYDNPGQAISGQVNVVITPIAPSANPMAMAGGSYVARVPGSDTQTQQIESFGAITVDLSQGGQRVQLAQGQKATIRIPLDTRSSERPATIPLYYWNETDKVWIQEGTATLKGNAASGYYYEGQVSHFSTWNADRPIEETVTVKGCLANENGSPVTGAQLYVLSDGLDYSGMAWGSLDKGQFTVQMKKGGHAQLILEDGSGETQRQTWDLGTHQTDTTLSTCFEVKQTTTPPATAMEAFSALLEAIGGGMELTLASGSAVDSELGFVMPADEACASGSITQLSLNFQTVLGRVELSPNTNYALSTRFAGCQPWAIPGSPGESADEVLTGDSLATFSYKEASDLTLSIGLIADLTQLTDSEGQRQANGQFSFASQESLDNQGRLTTTLTWMPRGGASLTNTRSGNTATFQKGSMVLVTVDDQFDVTVSRTVFYNELTYTQNGITYVLQGSLVNNVGQITQSRNGIVISTLTVSGSGITVTGMVDPL